MKKVLFLFLFFILGFCLYGQDQGDTTFLEPISIYGIPNKEYIIGQKVQEIDSSKKVMFRFSTLADLLASATPVYIKSYGNNMLSSISFRGTGASHTAVLWHGLNINSPTAGQTDFSLVPVAASDQVFVHYGSGSAVAGSGAIGGSIHLVSEPTWGRRFSVEMGQSVASYDTYSSQLTADFSNGQWQFKTKAYYKYSANDFGYTLPSTDEEVRQNNSAYRFFGFVQDINLRISNSQQLLLNVWLNNNDRELQPTIGNFNNQDEQQDRSIRLSTTYHNNSSLGFFTYRLGYLDDYLNYNHSSETRTKQIINMLECEKNIAGHLKLKSGITWNHITANVDGFEKKEEENRYNLYGLLLYTKPQWETSFNMRQNFVEGYKSPFAPAWGFKYKGIENFIFNLQASRNYRIPTLNNRYWNPGGNLNLRPEYSWNVEGGITKEGNTFKVSLNYYKMWVKDWILWVPEENYWTPKNLRKVGTEGIELSGKYILKLSNWKFVVGGFYAMNIARNQNSIADNDASEGRQLAYTPKNRVSAYLNVTKSEWFGALGGSYTGSRYTVSYNKLDRFALYELQIGRRFIVAKSSFNLSFQIKNLLDEEYELLENRALPGRNYQLNLIYKLTNNYETN